MKGKSVRVSKLSTPYRRWIYLQPDKGNWPFRIFFQSALAVFTTLFLLYVLCSPHLPFPLPRWDVSAALLEAQEWANVRWDAIHFTSIASKGYEYEQQLAFQPGWQGVLWAAGRIWRLFDRSATAIDSISKGGTILMILLAGWRGSALYNLTTQVFNPRVAYPTLLLYLLAPAPAVLASLHTEPLFACLTFSGYGLVMRQRYFYAAILLAAATSIRATGVLAAPTLAAMAIFRDGVYIIHPKLFVKRAISVAIPCIMVVAPFLAFQYYSYLSFCHPDSLMSWCNHRIPIAYSAVQAKYWNIGFLRYWTLGNLSSIIEAVPVLTISIMGLYRYYHGRTSLPRVVLPLVIHHAVMTFLLIFQSHTQIALRVCSTDPVFWWMLTDIAYKKDGVWLDHVDAEQWIYRPDHRGLTKAGERWIWWSVVWGAISIVLWAGFYPPA